MSERTGPWWIATFAWQGREAVIRFKVAPCRKRPAGYRPSRVELCTSGLYPEPNRAIKRHAAERFILKHAAIIADAYALAAHAG